MLNEEQITEIFTKTKVLLEGHFRLTSGLHAAKYMQCAQLLQYPEYTEVLLEQLAGYFAEQKITAVVGPATGAIILAYEAARHLKARSLFTEREEGKMVYRRGFTLTPEDRVLVVEDVVTTGGSVKEVIAATREKGAEVVGVGVLVDRSGGRVDFGVPLKALLTVDIQTYQPEECPLCAAGSVAIKPGSRQI